MGMAIRGALKLHWRPSKSSLFLSFSSSPTVGIGGAVADELNGYTVIKEGEAEILLADGNGVFYNKAQVNNRDMSIAVLRTFISKQKEEHDAMLSKKVNECAEESEDILKKSQNSISQKQQQELKAPRVLEALAASGLRSLRYAREIDEIGQVIALDNDKVSVETCKKNIRFNGSAACSKMEAHHADARLYMLTHPKEFDVAITVPFFTSHLC